MMNSSFFRNNRQNFLNVMQENTLAILYSGESIRNTADELYPFKSNRNFFYLTGIAKERAVLLITKQNHSVTETLYVPKVDPDIEKWNGRMLTCEDARKVSGIEKVEHTEDFLTHLNSTLLHGGFENLFLDFEHRGWSSPPTAIHAFAADIQARHPYLNLKNAYPVICRLRRVKSAEEVNNIRQAIRLTNEAFLSAVKHTQPEKKEYEIEAHYDYVLKANGAPRGFPSIIAAGRNATIMHYVDNNATMTNHDLLLMDIGAEHESYKADITRTIPVSGTFTQRQRAIYDVVLSAERATIEAVRPGIEHGTLNEITKRILAQGLQRLGVIQDAAELERYYFYNVSHYLGLDTHDVGEYGLLEPGMVLTIEPGIYIPEESIGVRIEDDVLVTESGVEVLSADILKDPDEIEKWMAAERAM